MLIPRFRRILTCLFAVVPVLLLAACAVPSRAVLMTVPDAVAPAVRANPELAGSMAVGSVSGGQESMPLWVSKVGDPEFREALESSLTLNGLRATDAAAARLVVDVELLALEQPFVGISMTVTPRVRYRVVERASQAEILNEELVTPYTASFSSAFIAAERLRLANEGAIRESIKAFLLKFVERWTARATASSGAAPANAVPVRDSARPGS